MTTKLTPTAEPSETPMAAPKAATRARRLRYLVVGLLTVAVAVAVWENLLKYRVTAKQWGVVTEGKIFRSGQISKWMIEKTLKKHGIQVIVDLTGLDPHDEGQQAEITAAKRFGIQLHRFPLRGDGTGDIHNYAKAIEVLVASERQHKPVLVHCAAGAQRTGGVVAAYRVLVLGQSPHDAYAELSRYGWKAHKDQILLEYLNGHMRELAELLVARKIIASVPDPLPVVEP